MTTDTYTLTTAVETINATFPTNVVNGVVTAAAATTTVNPGDIINAPVGSATTLNVTDTGGLGTDALLGVTLNNVSNLTVRSVTGNAVYNVGSAVGMRTVTDNNSLTTTAVTATEFQNLATGAGVVQSGAGTAGGHRTFFNYSTATNAVNVTVDGGVGRNGATFVAATAGAATAATINSTGAANGVTTAGAAAPVTFTLSGGTNTIKSLTVNAATDLNSKLVAADYSLTATALTVSGAANKVDLGTTAIFKTIDASGLTSGGLTVGVNGTLTSFKGGAGNDWLLANTTTPSAVSATAVIDSGAGFDTVSTSLINAGNSAVFKGFEQLDVTGQTAATTLDVSLLTNSTISDVVVTAAYGAGAGLANLVETASGFNLHVNGAGTNAFTLGFTAASVAGSSDVLNVDFFNKTGAAAVGGTYTVTGIEQIKLASSGLTGSTNTIGFSDDNLQSVTLTGDKAVTLSVVAQNPISGATATSLTTIDGSALTAGLTFVEAGPASGNLTGLTINGGSAADAITVVTANTAATGYGASTLTLGGGNDTVTVTNAVTQVASNAAAVTTITDIAAGDIIQGSAATLSTWVATKKDVSAATDFVNAVDIAFGAGTAKQAVWFQYGGNDYIAVDVGGTGAIATNDIIVKLTGLYDLSNSTIAGNAITIG